MAAPDRLADALAACQALLARAPSPRPEDLYGERTAEAFWRVAGGRVIHRGVARRDGMALRRPGPVSYTHLTLPTIYSV